MTESEALAAWGTALASQDWAAAAAAGVALSDHVGVRTAEGAHAIAAQAQVCATLALAEQQRAANLIAMTTDNRFRLRAGDVLPGTDLATEWRRVQEMTDEVARIVGFPRMTDLIQTLGADE